MVGAVPAGWAPLIVNLQLRIALFSHLPPWLIPRAAVAEPALILLPIRVVIRGVMMISCWVEWCIDGVPDGVGPDVD